jgi:hypothetical protein
MLNLTDSHGNCFIFKYMFEKKVFSLWKNQCTFAVCFK